MICIYQKKKRVYDRILRDARNNPMMFTLRTEIDEHSLLTICDSQDKASNSAAPQLCRQDSKVHTVECLGQFAKSTGVELQEMMR